MAHTVIAGTQAEHRGPLRLVMPVIVAGLLLVAAHPASAAGGGVPFKARFIGASAFTSPTTVSMVGSGIASHMGRITNVGQVVVTGPDGSCPGGIANVNTETLTAADGSTLTIASQDVGCPTGPGQFRGAGTWTVTGGTGRFAGTTGSGSTTGGSNFATGTFDLTMAGAISVPGAH